MRLTCCLVPTQLRPVESGRILRIRNRVGLPAESRELVAATLRHLPAHLGIIMLREILKRRRRTKLLTVKEHWDEWRRQNNSGSNFLPADIDQVTQALTLSSIAHLIVILSVAQKTMARETDGRPAVQAIPMF